MPVSRTTARLVVALAVAPVSAALLPGRAAANPADSQMFILDSVVFEGNQRVSTDKLNSVDGLTIGQKVNRDSIVQAFQNIVDEYQKENVGGTILPTMRQQGHHMSVVFQITEAAPAPTKVVQPVLDHETFTGNVKVSSDKLNPALTIKPGSPVTTEMVTADRDALTAVYKAAQVNVLVKPTITNLPEGHVDINYEITENPAHK